MRRLPAKFRLESLVTGYQANLLSGASLLQSETTKIFNVKQQFAL